MEDILSRRARKLNQIKTNSVPGPVVYCMSRDQRVFDNHALLIAQNEALQKGAPLIVLFVLYETCGYRTQEHYNFMLKGLPEVASELRSYNIPFLIRAGRPYKVIKSFVKKYAVSSLYFDFNTLRGSLNLHRQLANQLNIPVHEVDTRNIIPIWITSDKQEYSARTIRPKINRWLDEFLVEPPKLQRHKTDNKFAERTDRSENLLKMSGKIDSSHISILQESGEIAAIEVMKNFINDKLFGYEKWRNDPVKKYTSGLSPYLHFGQISSLRVAIEVRKSAINDRRLEVGKTALFEELIVRRELADNFCYYNPNYDSIKGAPEWAQKTLSKHANDKREHIYSFEKLEKALTHDEVWNYTQNQLLELGYIHGYLRMYWAKKVLEWTKDASTAVDYLVRLNDKYSIDGGESNGYVGILWSVAGLHDRPWPERPVFGLIRSMSLDGLKRKFKIDNLIQ